MNESTLDDYFVNYLPALIGRFLSDDPVPGMEGTVFTMQITITGEKDLVLGIVIRDARHITVTPGGVENPRLALQLPETIMRPLVKLASSMTGRKQYDLLGGTRGTMDVEISLPDGQDLPVRMVFNGAEEPNFKMSGSSRDLGKIASGLMDPTQAFMQGSIKLSGDLPFALRIAQLAPKK